MGEILTRGLLLRCFKETLQERDSGKQADLIRSALEKLNRDKPDLLESSAPAGYLDKLIAESLTFLTFQGILVPKSTCPEGEGPSSRGEYVITDYGREWAAAESEPIPEDAAGYVRFLKDCVAGVDPDVLQYAGEALSTFNRGFLTASAVLLGAASERILYLLAEDLIAGRDIDGEALAGHLERRRLQPLCDEVFALLRGLAESERMPFAVHEGCLAALQSLFSAIRLQRDEAVRPIAATVTKSQLRLLLLSFPHVCRKTGEVSDWLHRGPAS